jgi:hypothetical protein
MSRRTGAQQIARFRLRICCVRMLGPAKHELWHYHQRRDEQDRNDKRSWHGDPFDRRVPTNCMVINKGFLSDGGRVPSITQVTPPFKPTHAALDVPPIQTILGPH